MLTTYAIFNFFMECSLESTMFFCESAFLYAYMLVKRSLSHACNGHMSSLPNVHCSDPYAYAILVQIKIISVLD